MTVEVMGTAVVTMVLVIDYIPKYNYPLFLKWCGITNTIVIIPLCALCGACLAQCVYYRCCHTWSIINKQHYPFSSCHYSSVCGSYREGIFEEAEPEKGLVELEESTEADQVSLDGLTTFSRTLCCFGGSTFKSGKEEKTLGQSKKFGLKRSKSLPNMLATHNL